MNEAMRAAFESKNQIRGIHKNLDGSYIDAIQQAKWEGYQAALSQQPSIDALQYKIDNLMLEYCPGEMTKDQMANWEMHQIPSISSDIGIAISGASQQQAQPTVKESLTVHAQPSCEPVVWIHTMDNTQGCPENTAYTDITKSSAHPFGTAGIDYSEEFPVTSVPLYAAPPDYDALRAERDRLKQDLSDAILLKDNYLQEYRDLESVTQVQLEGLRAENLNLMTKRDKLQQLLMTALDTGRAAIAERDALKARNVELEPAFEKASKACSSALLALAHTSLDNPLYSDAYEEVNAMMPIFMELRKK